MIKDGWDKKEAQQPVAAAQLFMHLFLSLLSFTFQFLYVVLNIFKASENRRMDNFLVFYSTKFGILEFVITR